jgi:signal transduction histidine kinase
VAGGDYSARCAGSGSRDEVGRLTQSFNYMIGEVADYHGHLEKKVAEAQEKVKLAEKHLTVAQRLASTGKLAAGIAHEINNPIGGMINAAIKLKEQAEPGSRDEIYLNLIIEGLERIMKTVRNILAFSPRSTEPRPASVGSILRDVETLIEHRLNETAVRFEVSIEPEDLAVVCEAGEIRQVFLNVLINAVDAITKEGGLITVDARRDEKEKTAVIEVADNGCGMDEELVLHAFDPFYSTKPAGEGTGLGLSIAHNIVTNHGGRIEVDSTVGEGTAIRVILPFGASPSVGDSRSSG